MNIVIGIIVYILALPLYILECIVLSIIPRSWRAKKVEGEIVLITGGGSGIGRLMALRFADLGCKVVLWDVNKQGNEQTAQMIKRAGGIAYPYTCDLCSREDVYKVAAQTKSEVGVVTILVNNAGVVSGKYLLDTPDHLIKRTFDVNILCHFWTVKSFLPGMIEAKKGHIVTIASLAGLTGVSRIVDYCSSKFAAVGFDESLSCELIEQGHDEYIKTTVICPYYISTGMFNGVQSSLIPLLTPEQVADEIVDSILANEHIVKLPWSMNLVVLLTRSLPWKARMHGLKAMGDLNSTMSTFKGRQ